MLHVHLGMLFLLYYPNKEQILGYQTVIRNNTLEQLKISHPHQKNQIIHEEQHSYWMGKLYKGGYSYHKSTIIKFYN